MNLLIGFQNISYTFIIYSTFECLKNNHRKIYMWCQIRAMDFSTNEHLRFYTLITQKKRCLLQICLTWFQVEYWRVGNPRRPLLVLWLTSLASFLLYQQPAEQINTLIIWLYCYQKKRLYKTVYVLNVKHMDQFIYIPNRNNERDYRVHSNRFHLFS